MVEVAGGGGDAAVSELAGDDANVHALGTQLGGVGMAESVGVDAFVDASSECEAFEHDSDIGISHPRASWERCADPVGPAERRPRTFAPPSRVSQLRVSIAGRLLV